VIRMRYKLLGRTGLRVSELCLGAMIFGDSRGGWGASKDEAGRIVERFVEAGGNFVDTANYYARGASERIVGELIAAERERWVLSTKYTLSMRPDDPNAGGAHRKSLVRSLEASLRRLGTDYLDLYWVRAQQARSVIVPILGARRCEQLEDNLGALELELTAEELARLEEVSRVELGFPHDFGADRLAYGNTRPLIDNHRHPYSSHLDKARPASPARVRSKR
jgi:aryl-alcohol dehydrogenase-like predicted oxidoreductase